MQLIATALAAKRKPCPTCNARPNTACFEAGRQRLTLAETHHARLALVSDCPPEQDQHIHAEG